MKSHNDQDKCFLAFKTKYPKIAKCIEAAEYNNNDENLKDVIYYLKCIDQYDMFRVGWQSANYEYKRTS